MIFPIFCSPFGLATWIGASYALQHTPRSGGGAPINFTSISLNFTWTSIHPTPDLQYHDCGGNYQCARLQLPLDWNATASSPTRNETYNMAIVRLPAQVPVTDPRYGGPVLFNPGGPGGSGTQDVLAAGQLLQTMIDAAYADGSESYVAGDSSARYFDLIGFDPRGVGSSTPFLTCFQTPTAFQTFALETQDLELDWQSGNLDALWERIANFSSTAMVARDLVEFAERHGQWRGKQANQSGCNAEMREELQWKQVEEQINLLAVSYGTTLGATLAAMQPHRVHRFLLDGVQDAPSYYAGELTTDSRDSDAGVEKFFEYCALAGPELCPMWAGNSSLDTQRRLQSIYDDIRENGSIPVPGTADLAPDVITLDDVKFRVFRLNYGPLSSFPLAAESLAPLSERNGTVLAQVKQTLNAVDWQTLAATPHLHPNDPATTQVIPPGTFSGLALVALIQGGDSSARRSEQEFVAGPWAALRNETYWTGDATATQYLYFQHWPIHFGWRFSNAHPIASNVTANPILFASHSIDGVTTLASAQAAQARFKGSGLLVVDGEGHTTQYWRTAGYFCVCQVSERPFIGSDGLNTKKVIIAELSLEEQVLYEAQRQLSMLY
ncbi:hypothetical protein LTR74_016024 [Friedmanniomyces endolithicus]|nr:hypothetical protein LTR74_016024 [Friedmanniomyces endolithicus]